jgi:hypothetical protein
MDKQYSIQWLHYGRMHYCRVETWNAAIMIFEALFDKGYRPELWDGSTKLR